MRAFETSWPDDPEAIVSERIEAIAADVERFGGAIARDNERQAEALERIADVLEREETIRHALQWLNDEDLPAGDRVAHARDVLREGRT